MKLIESKIYGCYEIRPHVHKDERGSFIKTFHVPTFESFGLCTEFVEEYYSVSAKNVVRGMHFQLPPHDHEKLIYCTTGVVLDVVVDLRKGSPTYGQYESFKLTENIANMIYIPKGMAHGFCVLSDQSTMHYKVSTIYSPQYDSGIRWDSVGVDWPASNPIISPRDQGFLLLEDFNSPFVFKTKHE